MSDRTIYKNNTVIVDSVSPLTPDFRKQILDSIEDQMAVLNTCDTNAFVSVQKVALNAYRTLFNALPDGYLVPVTKQINK